MGAARPTLLAKLTLAGIAFGIVGACTNRKPTPSSGSSIAAFSPAIDRAVTSLGADVPRWHAEHGCFSCHHDGDGARALIVAHRAGHEQHAGSLHKTLAFLESPSIWRENGADGPFQDRRLATVQFSTTLGAAVASGLLDFPPLLASIELLLAEQAPSGTFATVVPGVLGGPTSWGSAWATAQALSTMRLVFTDPRTPDGVRTRTHQALERAADWLAMLESAAVCDHAAIVLGLSSAAHAAGTCIDWRRAQDRAIEALLTAQGSTGGFGPHARRPPEVFDTAAALLALCTAASTDPRIAGARARARDWLREQQLDDGFWRETTRPSGGISNAQSSSTTAWALEALLAAMVNDPDPT